MVEAIRSFIAFDLDSQSVLQKITDIQTVLVETGADLKIVEPQNIHVTVRFLGNITPQMVEEVFDAMKKIQFVPFDIGIRGAGAFPDARYPRVCWVGMTEGSDQLRGIFSQLEPQLRSLGFEPDSRGFNPHLTIARVRSGRNRDELAKSIVENSDFDSGMIRAQCLRLKRSDLTPKGPIYSTLREYCP